MKTIGRILIILAVFFLVGAVFVTAVNALTPSSASAFGNRPDNGQGFRTGGARPEGGGDGGRREGGRFGMAGLAFGAVKNIAVVAVFVTIIVWPKSLAKKKRREAAIVEDTNNNVKASL